MGVRNSCGVYKIMMKIFKRKRKALPKIHWKDITIAKHKAINEVYARYADAEDDIMFIYDLTAAAYGKDEDWLNGLKVSEANDYANSLAFVNERPKPRMVKSEYLLNGHKYRLTMNMQEISTAQYIDFQQMWDKADEMPAEFLSIILIPDGHKYNEGYDISDVVKDIENHMSVEDAMGMSAFFLRLLEISMRRSVRQLKRMESKARKEGLMTEEQLEALHKIRLLFESANGLRR